MPVTLPTITTKPKLHLAEYTILLYGEPKIGKSTFASQFEKPLFLATEAGLNALETYQIPVSSWADFLEACKLLATTKHDYKTIIIDTIDNLVKFCAEATLKPHDATHESDMGYGKGYDLVANELLRVLTKLSQLPPGLIMISHAETKEIKTRTSVLNKTSPTLPNKYKKIVLGMADLVLYAHSVEQKTEKGAEQVRVIETKPSECFDAGDRTKRLPATISMDYQEFMKIWGGK
jgi:Ni,Fe-hydrogenase maturation factor